MGKQSRFPNDVGVKPTKLALKLKKSGHEKWLSLTSELSSVFRAYLIFILIVFLNIFLFINL
jgi:hypothetical protein